MPGQKTLTLFDFLTILMVATVVEKGNLKGTIDLLDSMRSGRHCEAGDGIYLKPQADVTGAQQQQAGAVAVLAPQNGVPLLVGQRQLLLLLPHAVHLQACRRPPASHLLHVRPEEKQPESRDSTRGAAFKDCIVRM